MNRWIWTLGLLGAVACGGNKTGTDAGTDSGTTTDAGGCGVDTCNITPTGCFPQDTCSPNGQWICHYTCPDAGTDAGNIVITPATICQDLAQRECNFYQRCFTTQDFNNFDPAQSRNNPATDVNYQLAPSEVANCVAKMTADPSCVLEAASWNKGRTTIDTAKYAACVTTAYPANTCSRDLNQTLALCGKFPFVSANQTASAMCTNDRDCKNGWCTVNGPACGTCQAYLALTASCMRDAQCDPTSGYCPGPDTTSPQDAGCTAYTALDAGCNIQDTEQEECGPGNVCAVTSINFVTQTPITQCEVGVKQGQPCTEDFFQCFRSAHSFPPAGIPELICAGAATAAVGVPGTCVPFQTTDGGGCLTGEFPPGGSASIPICLENQRCVANQCVARVGNGGACTANSDCAQGFICGANSTCTPLGTLDAGCASDSDCDNFLGCANGANCSPDFAPLGGACDGTTPPNGTLFCATGYCELDGGVTGVCTPLKADGAACAENAECASLSCSTTCQSSCWK